MSEENEQTVSDPFEPVVIFADTEKGTKTMKCTDCKYCYQQDTGYSNYTVMGTDVECLKKKHPDGCFDLFYEEDKRLYFAEKCGDFVEGEGLMIDCDMEYGDINAYTDDPEIKELYEAI